MEGQRHDRGTSGNDHQSTRRSDVVRRDLHRPMVWLQALGLLVALCASANRDVLAYAEWDTTTDRSILIDIYDATIDNNFSSYGHLYNISQNTLTSNYNTAYIADMLSGVNNDLAINDGVEVRLDTLISHVDELEYLTQLIQLQTDQLEDINTAIELDTSVMRQDIRNEIRPLLEDILEQVTDYDGTTPAPADPGTFTQPAQGDFDELDPVVTNRTAYLIQNDSAPGDLEPAEFGEIVIPEMDESVPDLDFTVPTSNFSGIFGMSLPDFDIEIDELWVRDVFRPIVAPIMLGFAAWAAILMVWEEFRRYG